MARPAHPTHRTRLLTVLCALVLALGPAAQAAWAQDPSASASQPPATAQVAGSVAATAGQIAAASATAAQQAPLNVAIPVQVLSPGDSGAITQVNAVSAGAGATNVQVA